MDLCAEMLLRTIHVEAAGDVTAMGIRPRFRHLAGRIPGIRRLSIACNSDRLANRLWWYPQHVSRCADDFDVFHVCDHSYAHLVHHLPAERTGVYCHDLDTFRCLLDPAREPRPSWFRQMSRYILDGLQRAAVVFCNSQVTREQIVAAGIVSAEQVVHAPLGISPEFTADVDDSADSVRDEVDSLLSNSRGKPFVLHVGSCIPRKRIDVLLKVFAGVCSRLPDLHLVQIGGSWTQAQKALIRRLGIASSLSQARGVSRSALAKLYRRASLVLQTSDAEGFGLPVIEALACGSVVVASNIPVFREVGAEAVVYCTKGEIDEWVDVVCELLREPELAPLRCRRLQQASRYSWSTHTQTILSTYRNLVESCSRPERMTDDERPMAAFQSTVIDR